MWQKVTDREILIVVADRSERALGPDSLDCLVNELRARYGSDLIHSKAALSQRTRRLHKLGLLGGSVLKGRGLVTLTLFVTNAGLAFLESGEDNAQSAPTSES